MSAVETNSSSSGFRPQLGLFDATMLVAGTMIGSGIFIVSADIARDVGSSGWLMLVWVLTGVMTIIGALSYAELAAMMPNAGGQYVYLREAYGPLPAFLYGWTCFLVIQTGSIAAVGVAFAKFLGVLVPSLGTDTILWQIGDKVKLTLPVPWMDEPPVFFERPDGFTISAGQLVAVLVVAFLSLLNCRGVREGKIVQNTFTVAKTLALILLIVVGLTIAVNPSAVADNTADIWGGIAQTGRYDEVSRFAPISALAIVLVVCGAMVGSLFSADAWNNITFTAGEITNPRRNLPGALALGTGLVIVLYLLANVAYLSVLPVQPNPEVVRQLRVIDDQLEVAAKVGDEELIKALKRKKDETGSTFDRGIALARDDRVGTAVLQETSPNFGVPFMAIAIMISTFGCVNGMILMGARLYYAMAQDRLFFQSVGTLNDRGVPAVGLILQGVWSIVLVFSGSYDDLLTYVIFAVLIFYVLTVWGLFILRRTMPDASRPYRAFGYPVIPALYIAMCAIICVALLIVKPVYSWPSFLLVLTGIPVYYLWPGKART